MSELVQPIAVAKAGSHESVVTAVASASVFAWFISRSNPRWEEWLSGRFTKTVRRCSVAKLDAFFEAEKDSGDVTSLIPARWEEDDAIALGCVPMTYEEMPEALRKMQVAEFNRERSGEWHPNPKGPRIFINADLEMSTGKTAAQVAHGLFGFILAQTEDYREIWLNTHLPFEIAEVRDVAWKSAARRARVVINDAGLTEIEPGSATVAVV